MHHGIEILLARMESHPEDFVQGRSAPWLQIINGYKKFFIEEEGLAIRDALRKINMDSMVEDIMKRMVKEDNPTPFEQLQSAKDKATQMMQEELNKAFNQAYDEGWEEITEEEIDETFPLKNYSVGFKVIKEDIE